MLRLLCAPLCFTCLLFADNFIDSKAWAADNDTQVIDRGLPSESALPLTMPKTPLPAVEPIVEEKVAGGGNQNLEPVFEIEDAAPASQASFWVQVGAFISAQAAADLAARFEEEGFNAQIFTKELNRVAVGPFASVNQAEASLRRIRAIKADAFIATIDRLR
ncbi:MAG: SPOR domain-containing protein [Helicobacteraceae bacterium]|jgi:cell division septation protein DedD|nr:SPOR domain-containing protein [Helicobacteraceae bacterium]